MQLTFVNYLELFLPFLSIISQRFGPRVNTWHVNISLGGVFFKEHLEGFTTHFKGGWHNNIDKSWQRQWNWWDLLWMSAPLRLLYFFCLEKTPMSSMSECRTWGVVCFYCLRSFHSEYQRFFIWVKYPCQKSSSRLVLINRTKILKSEWRGKKNLKKNYALRKSSGFLS